MRPSFLIDMDNIKCDLDLLFETSWEVCNKVGGIYTVLSTKANTLRKLYDDNVIFIGPDVWDKKNKSPYFSSRPSLLADWQKTANLPYGITARVGRWKVPGRPIVVLVGFQGLYAVKDEFYGKMWELFGVDSLHAYGDYDEGCAFAHAAGIVIESLCRYFGIAGKRVVAHFDEWTTGMGLLYTKWKLPEIATVFTTHATCVGRSICGNGKPLYDYMRGYNGDQMARELNMEAKHSLEKTAAHQADCFTTVSDVTAIECEQLLEIRPYVTPNGFENNFVPKKANYDSKRQWARERLLKVAQDLTGHDYPENTFIVLTSGRFEYRNKGLDMFLDSIVRLNDLKSSKQKIVAFIAVPAWVKGPRRDLAERLGSSREWHTGLHDPFVTHDLHNPGEDSILCRIRSLALDNSNEKAVEVFYMPCYLNETDEIIRSTYYDILVGADATVFPSYYEPWGYTPLESVAFGIPTITTSLSGFGRWIEKSSEAKFEASGTNVVCRTDSNYSEAVSSIAESLHYLTNLTGNGLKRVKAGAFATADKAAWSAFMQYYVDAYREALENANERNN